MENPETLIIGGTMGASAVGAVAWFVKAMGARIVKQFDEGNAAMARAIAELGGRMDALSNEVHRNTAQTTGLAVDLGAQKQRIDMLDQRVEGQRDFYRAEHEKTRSDVERVKSQTTELQVTVARVQADIQLLMGRMKNE